MMNYNLSISGKHYDSLRKHLYPGDGCEAVAIALCGRHAYKNEGKLLVHRLILIPHEHCETREPDLVIWSTALLTPHLPEAVKRGWAVVKIHSHPTGYPKFSHTDDNSDRDLFESIFGWMDSNEPHGSLIMLPAGEIFGRVITPELKFVPINSVALIGDDLKFWFMDRVENPVPEFAQRTMQTFGPGTTSLLNNLKIGIVGCSGTGSPVVEQLVRLGVGELVLVDPDKVEKKNLNRILNTTMQDATEGRFKVDVLEGAIKKMGLETVVTVFRENIYDNVNLIQCLASCDVLFGCMDSVDGRHLLNQIASFYLIPYFDLGIKLIADGKGGIEHICGAIHYLQPGGGSLQSRKLYTPEELRASIMLRSNQAEFDEQKKSGYIVNINVDSPAVISVNMYAASMAVNEFLARIHSFRYDDNRNFAVTRFSISDGYIQQECDGEVDEYLNKYIGRGEMVPLLNMPQLS